MREEEAKNTPQLLVFLFPPWKNPITTSELLGKNARSSKAPETLQSRVFFPPELRIWGDGGAFSFPLCIPERSSPGALAGAGPAGVRIDAWMPGWSSGMRGLPR